MPSDRPGTTSSPSRGFWNAISRMKPKYSTSMAADSRVTMRARAAASSASLSCGSSIARQTTTMPYRSGAFAFRDLRELMARANEPKSGDALAGLAAGSAEERVAAKRALADVPLRRFVEEPLIPPERDELTRVFLTE